MKHSTAAKTAPRPSARAEAIQPSPTLSITSRAAELRAQGKDIISLSSGEPDFDTPEYIKEAAVRAMREGHTKYTPVGGLPELKQDIIDKLERDNRLSYSTGEVLVSCGCKHSLYNLTQALLDPGDEVIIPAPYWVSYPEMAKLAGAIPKIIQAGADQHFKITPEQLEQAITPRTRMFILNSPNNPSGAYYLEPELAALGEVIKRHPGICIVSDDIYEHILWDRPPFKNILNTHPELADRTILCNGVSKAYSMTGWRIGYAAGPREIILAMQKIQSQSTSNPCSISQYAAMAALRNGREDSSKGKDIFKQRHDYVHRHLAKMPYLTCLPSAGTFYLFPDLTEAVQRQGLNDIQFAEHLLERAGIALVPGSAFGTPGHYRISFSTDLEVLKEAMGRLERTLRAIN